MVSETCPDCDEYRTVARQADAYAIRASSETARLTDQLATAQARIVALTTALRPFTAASSSTDGGKTWTLMIDTADMDRARAALGEAGA